MGFKALHNPLTPIHQSWSLKKTIKHLLSTYLQSLSVYLYSILSLVLSAFKFDVFSSLLLQPFWSKECLSNLDNWKYTWNCGCSFMLQHNGRWQYCNTISNNLPIQQTWTHRVIQNILKNVSGSFTIFYPLFQYKCWLIWISPAQFKTEMLQYNLTQNCCMFKISDNHINGQK